MNALVFNKCEYEFLCIAKEISQKLNVDINIETEALGEGSLRSWFRFRSEDKNALRLGVILYFITNFLGTPFTTTIDELTRMAIQSVFESEEVKQLKEEKKIAELKYDITKIESEIVKLCSNIDENILKKRRSNYYETINSCDKVNKIAISITDNKNSNIYFQKEINKIEFESYIMTSDDIEPENDENAIIEIVSPVLKKGKYKWTGIYKGNIISFAMKSSEFKTLVQTGVVLFKNGTSINSHLITNKKINKDGEIYISGYEVVLVNQYFDNDKPIETPEGKRKRQNVENEKMQLKLF
ncbi:MAG: hypothetical protein UD103_00195 [Bacteroidales bacterium]|nr:hypothetical protein [Bacteroidales bacterium]